MLVGECYFFFVIAVKVVRRIGGRKLSKLLFYDLGFLGSRKLGYLVGEKSF